MKPAARVTDPTTHGSPLAPGPGSPNVLIANLPAWRAIIDQHACPAANVSGADGVGNVLIGSPTVWINNQMACRQGDIVIEKPGLAMGPANPIVMGCPTVLIGESGAASPGAPTPPGPMGASASTLKKAAKGGTPLVERCHEEPPEESQAPATQTAPPISSSEAEGQVTTMRTAAQHGRPFCEVCQDENGPSSSAQTDSGAEPSGRRD